MLKLLITNMLICSQARLQIRTYVRVHADVIIRLFASTSLGTKVEDTGYCIMDRPILELNADCEYRAVSPSSHICVSR
jgi:hypothetical protein